MGEVKSLNSCPEADETHGIHFAFCLNQLLLHRHSHTGPAFSGFKQTTRWQTPTNMNIRSLSCGGCAKTVEKALKELEGITSYEILLEQQKVEVVTSLQSSTVFQTLLQTGKKAVLSDTN